MADDHLSTNISKIAKRFNKGKLQLSYLLDFGVAIKELVKVCMFGAKKYARDNWKKGRPYRDTIDSLLRHVDSFQGGQTLDDESGCHHLAHAAWNALALCYWNMMGIPDLDDRDGAAIDEASDTNETK